MRAAPPDSPAARGLDEVGGLASRTIQYLNTIYGKLKLCENIAAIEYSELPTLLAYIMCIKFIILGLIAALFCNLLGLVVGIVSGIMFWNCRIRSSVHSIALVFCQEDCKSCIDWYYCCAFPIFLVVSFSVFFETSLLLYSSSISFPSSRGFTSNV